MGKYCLRIIIALSVAASLSGCLEGQAGKDGADGKSATPVLLSTSSEPAGTNCTAGGTRIDSGQDANLNGALDATEIQATSYTCNGTDGSPGSDGFTSLISTASEPAGTNCAAGGYKVESGLDSNANGTLDPAEVLATSYICNGQDGSDGLVSLVNVEPEPAGANCASGGQRIDSGLDANGNGSLDVAEQSTAYVCNGADGSSGLNALVSVINEPAGENCTSGGYRIDSGLDANTNDVLDISEIQSTSYICNGGPSTNSASNLNDTGVISCGDYADSATGGVSDNYQNGLDCTTTGTTASTGGIDGEGDPVPAGQDALYGRDALAERGALSKVGAGGAGFDFTKIDSNGATLADDASSWSCVRDNVTGLIWEVKTSDGGLHDTSNSYTWYEPDTLRNGGDAGTADGGTCTGGTGCDTSTFVSDVNVEGLCGHNDWRIPSRTELFSLVDIGHLQPVADLNYFPNTAAIASYWTQDPWASQNLKAWIVDFSGGNLGIPSNYAWVVMMVVIALGWHIVWQCYKKAGKVKGF